MLNEQEKFFLKSLEYAGTILGLIPKTGWQLPSLITGVVNLISDTLNDDQHYNAGNVIVKQYLDKKDEGVVQNGLVTEIIERPKQNGDLWYTGFASLVGDASNQNILRGNTDKNRITALTGGKTEEFTNELYGGAGEDRLTGAQGGMDILDGGTETDQYYFSAGHGHDVIKETNQSQMYDFINGNINLIDIPMDVLEYRRVKSDLEIITGDDSSITISRYFDDTAGDTGSGSVNYQNDISINGKK